MKTIGICLKEMRIKSWIKNAFVFSPLIFSHEMLEVSRLTGALILTLAFCLVSSSVYIWNDIIDVENDRLHEKKRNRPIASGKLSIKSAWILLTILLLAGVGLALWQNLEAFCYIAAYLVINILYSVWLKTKVIVDCFCIAAGFVLRVMAGGTVVSEGISDWMFLTVLAMALFMAFGKRRGELTTYKSSETRDVLEDYDPVFLSGIVMICAGLTMIFYCLWSISHTTGLVYTVPIVIFIVIRYLWLVFCGCEEADPTALILSDKVLLFAGGLCGLVMLYMLYGPV